MTDILQPTDQFLVNRADSTKTVTTENLMAELQDSDLMLVNRSDTTYKITGKDVKDSLTPAPNPISFTPTIVGENKVGDVLTASAGTITGGVNPVVYGYQWKRDDVDIDGDVKLNTDADVAVNADLHL